jgi:hypothetical protein
MATTNPGKYAVPSELPPEFANRDGDDWMMQAIRSWRNVWTKSFAKWKPRSQLSAHVDTFFMFTVVAVAHIAPVFFMKRSVAEKGGHVAAE